MEKEQGIEKIPTWALCYVINGDATGLSDNDIQVIDEALETLCIEQVICPGDGDEPYFTSYPLFGIASEVIDCMVIYK